MAAVGENVQVDVLGQDLPVTVPARVVRRAWVVGGGDYSDRCEQLHRRRRVRGVGEIEACGYEVVPIGGTDVLGALRTQFAEFGVAAVRAQPCGNLSIAAPTQL